MTNYFRIVNEHVVANFLSYMNCNSFIYYYFIYLFWLVLELKIGSHNLQNSHGPITFAFGAFVSDCLTSRAESSIDGYDLLTGKIQDLGFTRLGF